MVDPYRLRHEIQGKDQASILKLARPIPQGNICPACDKPQASWEGGVAAIHQTSEAIWRYYICAPCSHRIWVRHNEARRGRELARLERLTNIAIALVIATDEHAYQLSGKVTLHQN